MNPRIVWITGAGKGIGRATAIRYATAGWHVAASARTREDLDSLVSEAAGLKGEIQPFPLDVTDAQAVRSVCQDIETNMGPVDLAILNAGFIETLSMKAFDVSVFKRLMDTNFYGVLYCIDALLPGFTERRKGHVAIVSSIAGYCGLPLVSAYGATKAALINMAESLKPDLADRGIRLQIIIPAFVKTPLLDGQKYPKPLMISSERAARHIYDGIRGGRFEICTPWLMVAVLKILRMLPYSLFFMITRRLRWEN